jgi:SAM-dependent methyltransferase
MRVYLQCGRAAGAHRRILWQCLPATDAHRQCSEHQFIGSRRCADGARRGGFSVEVTGGRESGSILEAGAGKGESLLQFLNLKSAWRSVALEPSSAAARLKELLPGTKVIHSGYQEARIEGEFDVILSAAVIEHVERPLEFMRWLGQRVNGRGHLVLTFPDFCRNPNDLFCVDHSSKIARPQLEMMARCAGLTVVATKHVGIAMFAALRRAGAEDGINPVLGPARELIARNTALAESMVDSVANANRTAKERNEAFAVFGLGMSGLIAPVLRNFPRADIGAYIDENPTMQGLTIGGSPVIGLREIASRGIRHVALSVSPIYRAQVLEKLRPYGVSVYA